MAFLCFQTLDVFLLLCGIFCCFHHSGIFSVFNIVLISDVFAVVSFLTFSRLWHFQCFVILSLSCFQCFFTIVAFSVFLSLSCFCSCVIYAIFIIMAFSVFLSLSCFCSCVIYAIFIIVAFSVFLSLSCFCCCHFYIFIIMAFFNFTD